MSSPVHGKRTASTYDGTENDSPSKRARTEPSPPLGIPNLPTAVPTLLAAPIPFEVELSSDGEGEDPHVDAVAAIEAALRADVPAPAQAQAPSSNSDSDDDVDFGGGLDRMLATIAAARGGGGEGGGPPSSMPEDCGPDRREVFTVTATAGNHLKRTLGDLLGEFMILYMRILMHLGKVDEDKITVTAMSIDNDVLAAAVLKHASLLGDDELVAECNAQASTLDDHVRSAKIYALMSDDGFMETIMACSREMMRPIADAEYLTIGDTTTLNFAPRGTMSYTFSFTLNVPANKTREEFVRDALVLAMDVASGDKDPSPNERNETQWGAVTGIVDNSVVGQAGTVEIERATAIAESKTNSDEKSTGKIKDLYKKVVTTMITKFMGTKNKELPDILAESRNGKFARSVKLIALTIDPANKSAVYTSTHGMQELDLDGPLIQTLALEDVHEFIAASIHVCAFTHKSLIANRTLAVLADHQWDEDSDGNFTPLCSFKFAGLYVSKSVTDIAKEHLTILSIADRFEELRVMVGILGERIFAFINNLDDVATEAPFPSGGVVGLNGTRVFGMIRVNRSDTVKEYRQSVLVETSQRDEYTARLVRDRGRLDGVGGSAAAYVMTILPADIVPILSGLAMLLSKSMGFSSRIFPATTAASLYRRAQEVADFEKRPCADDTTIRIVAEDVLTLFEEIARLEVRVVELTMIAIMQRCEAVVHIQTAKGNNNEEVVIESIDDPEVANKGFLELFHQLVRGLVDIDAGDVEPVMVGQSVLGIDQISTAFTYMTQAGYNNGLMIRIMNYILGGMISPNTYVTRGISYPGEAEAGKSHLGLLINEIVSGHIGGMDTDGAAANENNSNWGCFGQRPEGSLLPDEAAKLTSLVQRGKANLKTGCTDRESSVKSVHIDKEGLKLKKVKHYQNYVPDFNLGNYVGPTERALESRTSYVHPIKMKRRIIDGEKTDGTNPSAKILRVHQRDRRRYVVAVVRLSGCASRTSNVLSESRAPLRGIVNRVVNNCGRAIFGVGGKHEPRAYDTAENGAVAQSTAGVALLMGQGRGNTSSMLNALSVGEIPSPDLFGEILNSYINEITNRRTVQLIALFADTLSQRGLKAMVPIAEAESAKKAPKQAYVRTDGLDMPVWWMVTTISFWAYRAECVKEVVKRATTLLTEASKLIADLLSIEEAFLTMSPDGVATVLTVFAGIAEVATRTADIPTNVNGDAVHLNQEDNMHALSIVEQFAREEQVSAMREVLLKVITVQKSIIRRGNKSAEYFHDMLRVSTDNLIQHLLVNTDGDRVVVGVAGLVHKAAKYSPGKMNPGEVCIGPTATIKELSGVDSNGSTVIHASFANASFDLADSYREINGGESVDPTTAFSAFGEVTGDLGSVASKDGRQAPKPPKRQLLMGRVFTQKSIWNAHTIGDVMVSKLMRQFVMVATRDRGSSRPVGDTVNALLRMSGAFGSKACDKPTHAAKAHAIDVDTQRTTINENMNAAALAIAKNHLAMSEKALVDILCGAEGCTGGVLTMVTTAHNTLCTYFRSATVCYTATFGLMSNGDLLVNPYCMSVETTPTAGPLVTSLRAMAAIPGFFAPLPSVGAFVTGETLHHKINNTEGEGRRIKNITFSLVSLYHPQSMNTYYAKEVARDLRRGTPTTVFVRDEPLMEREATTEAPLESSISRAMTNLSADFIDCLQGGHARLQETVVAVSTVEQSAYGTGRLIARARTLPTVAMPIPGQGQGPGLGPIPIPTNTVPVVAIDPKNTTQLISATLVTSTTPDTDMTSPPSVVRATLVAAGRDLVDVTGDAFSRVQKDLPKQSACAVPVLMADLEEEYDFVANAPLVFHRIAALPATVAQNLAAMLRTVINPTTRSPSHGVHLRSSTQLEVLDVSTIKKCIDKLDAVKTLVERKETLLSTMCHEDRMTLFAVIRQLVLMDFATNPILSCGANVLDAVLASAQGPIGWLVAFFDDHNYDTNILLYLLHTCVRTVEKPSTPHRKKMQVDLPSTIVAGALAWNLPRCTSNRVLAVWRMMSSSAVLRSAADIDNLCKYIPTSKIPIANHVRVLAESGALDRDMVSYEIFEGEEDIHPIEILCTAVVIEGSSKVNLAAMMAVLSFGLLAPAFILEHHLPTPSRKLASHTRWQAPTLPGVMRNILNPGTYCATVADLQVTTRLQPVDSSIAALTASMAKLQEIDNTLNGVCHADSGSRALRIRADVLATTLPQGSVCATLGDHLAESPYYNAGRLPFGVAAATVMRIRYAMSTISGPGAGVAVLMEVADAEQADVPPYDFDFDNDDDIFD